ncbi:hypothetical protein [Tranquillimonas rosea]|nr:hypothetical protein [Tranquillimonas rosea]
MFDTTHPWFRPLWVRIVLLAVTAGWGLVELSAGNAGWALLFLALAAWVTWALFVTYTPGPDTTDTPDDHDKDGET